jgi:hypothetical protein
MCKIVASGNPASCRAVTSFPHEKPRTEGKLLDKLQHVTILFDQFSRAIVLLDSSG